jgi:hypothetical protein
MDALRYDPDQRSHSAVVMAVSLSYVECDIPDGATLREWRRSRLAGRPAQPSVWRRMVRRDRP